MLMVFEGAFEGALTMGLGAGLACGVGASLGVSLTSSTTGVATTCFVSGVSSLGASGAFASSTSSVRIFFLKRLPVQPVPSEWQM